MADAIFINKADGDNISKAKIACREYANALHLFPLPESGWMPVVDTCSSKVPGGVEHVWKIIGDYYSLAMGNGYFLRKRSEQNLQVLSDAIDESLKSNFYSRKEIVHLKKKFEEEIMAGTINPYSAAKDLLLKYYSSFH